LLVFGRLGDERTCTLMYLLIIDRIGGVLVSYYSLGNVLVSY